MFAEKKWIDKYGGSNIFSVQHLKLEIVNMMNLYLTEVKVLEGKIEKKIAYYFTTKEQSLLRLQIIPL